MEALQNRMENMFKYCLNKPLKYCMKKPLKIMNSIIAALGIFMVLCSSWMIKIWERDINDGSLSFPGYLHYFLGFGIAMCVIAWFGHVALKNVNTNFLCFVFYEVISFLVVFVNVGFSMHFICPDCPDMEVFPEDPTGKFNDLKNFAEPIFFINFIFSLIILLVEMLSLAMAASNGFIDENDDYAPLPEV